MVHYITYELAGIRLPDETGKIEDTIKSFGHAYAFMKNAWIVESEVDNKEISEKLLGLFRPKDRVLVTRIHKDWVMMNTTEEERAWIGQLNFASVADPPLFRR